MNGPQCQFCAAEAVDVCDWPVERFTITTCDQLQVGDEVCRFDEVRKRTRRRAFVDQLLIQLRKRKVHITIRIACVNGKSLYKSYRWKAEAQVKVLQRVPCGAHFCEDDGCDRGGKSYCRDHWNAWEGEEREEAT